MRNVAILESLTALARPLASRGCLCHSGFVIDSTFVIGHSSLRLGHPTVAPLRRAPCSAENHNREPHPSGGTPFLSSFSAFPFSLSVTLQPSGVVASHAFAKSGDGHVSAPLRQAQGRSAGASLPRRSFRAEAGHRFSHAARRRNAGGKRGPASARYGGLRLGRLPLAGCPRFPRSLA